MANMHWVKGSQLRLVSTLDTLVFNLLVSNLNSMSLLARKKIYPSHIYKYLKISN